MVTIRAPSRALEEGSEIKIPNFKIDHMKYRNIKIQNGGYDETSLKSLKVFHRLYFTEKYTFMLFIYT